MVRCIICLHPFTCIYICLCFHCSTADIWIYLFCFNSRSFSNFSQFLCITVCHLLGSRYFKCRTNFLVFLATFKSSAVVITAICTLYSGTFTILVVMCSTASWTTWFFTILILGFMPVHLAFSASCRCKNIC